eukprot:786534_1
MALCKMLNSRLNLIVSGRNQIMENLHACIFMLFIIFCIILLLCEVPIPNNVWILHAKPSKIPTITFNQAIVDKYDNHYIPRHANLFNLSDEILNNIMHSWSIKSLLNKTILFDGDSLLKYNFLYLHDILEMHCVCKQFHKDKFETTVIIFVHFADCYNLNGFIKIKLHFHYNALHHHIFDATLFSQLTEPLNVVIIDAAALHLRPIYPAELLEHRTMDILLHLESYLDKFVGIVSTSNITKCAIITTINPICHHRFWRSFRTVGQFYENVHNFHNNISVNVTECINKFARAQFYSDKISLNVSDLCLTENIIEKEKLIIDECVKSLANDIYKEDGDIDFEKNMASLRYFCSYNNSRTYYGSQTIAKRVRDYVYTHQVDVYEKYGVNLLLYDYFKVVEHYPQYCEYSRDGTHFDSFHYILTAGLADIVHNFC